MASVFVAVMPVSCARMDTVMPQVDFCSVGLRLTLDEIPVSKAPSGDYDDGRSVFYENYINVAQNDFRLLLFESSAPYKLVTEIKNIEITAVEADVRTSKTYVIIGEAPTSVGNASYKVVFVANWVGCGGVYPVVVPGVSTIDDISSVSSYNYAAGFGLGLGRGIPMFGIKDCADVEFVPNEFTDLGRLHLLRAMAKIEVKPAEDGLPISSVVLTRANTTGLAAPFGIYAQSDYVRNTYVNDYLDNLYLPNPVSVAADIPFAKQSDGSFVLYVPEYDNTSASAIQSRIHLVFDAGEGMDVSDNLDFKYYSYQAAYDSGKSLGEEFDVKRNHYYKYTVKKKADLSVNIFVDVVPYSEVILKPEFGL